MIWQSWIVALAFFVFSGITLFLHTKYIKGKSFPIIFRLILLGAIGLVPIILSFAIGMIIQAVSFSDFVGIIGIAGSVFVIFIIVGWLISSIVYLIFLIMSRISVAAKKRGNTDIHIRIRHICVFLYRTFIKVDLPHLHDVMSAMYSSQSEKRGEWLQDQWRY